MIKGSSKKQKEVLNSYTCQLLFHQVHYEYTQLKDCDPQHDGTFNFYAIVLDAQFPHRSFKSDKYICSIKIADPYQPIDKEGVMEHCTIVFFAKRFEDLPITQRVGDIIRVHRAYVSTFKGVKQFTANVFFNSSWALFSPLNAKQASQDIDEALVKAENKKSSEREFYPFSFYGKQFSFEASEKKTIKYYRDWLAKAFAKNHILSSKYITPLADIPQKGGKQPENGKYYDFDLQVRVVQVFRLDDYSSEMRVVDDSNQIWFCQILNLKYRWVREGQVLRIRSATLEHHDKYDKVFGLKNYSNILSLPYPSLLAKEMKYDMHQAERDLDKALLTQDEKIMHPVLASSILNRKVYSTPLRTLEQIMTDAQHLQKQPHRVRLTVEAISPSLDKLNPKQLVKILNTKTNELKDASKQKGALSKDEKYIIHMQLYCQDYSNYLSNQFVRVVVNDSSAKGQGLFKSISAEDLYKKKEAQDQVKSTLVNLLKFNVWLDTAVEISDAGYLVLTETQINEY
eukprot:403363589